MDSSLGHPTETAMTVSQDLEVRGWIEKLSQGGLIVPPDDWLNQIKQFEVVLCSMNGKSPKQQTFCYKRPW